MSNIANKHFLESIEKMIDGLNDYHEDQIELYNPEFPAKSAEQIWQERHTNHLKNETFSTEVIALRVATEAKWDLFLALFELKMDEMIEALPGMAP